MQEDSQRFYGAHLMGKKKGKKQWKILAQGKSCFNYRHMPLGLEMEAKAERLAISAAPNSRLTLFRDWMQDSEWVLNTCEWLPIYPSDCVCVCPVQSASKGKASLDVTVPPITYAKFNFANENGAGRGKKSRGKAACREPVWQTQSTYKSQSQWPAKVMACT